MIEIQNLSKRFGTLLAVNDISLTVQRGEILGFLGPNGAGKSTTMRMITGFLTPDRGRIAINGVDLSAQPLVAKRQMGYLPEGAPLYSDMTPRAFLTFIAGVRGYGQQRETKVDAVAEQINLHGVMDQPINTLSKGYKRRVGLAQAILHNPQILILDEPTDGLDPNQKRDVRQLVQQMSADKAIILSTHILEEVEAICSRTIVIANGRIVSDSTPAALLARSDLYNVIRMTVRGVAAETLLSVLESQPLVRKVKVLADTDDRITMQIFPQTKQPLSQAISELAHQRGWLVQELYAEHGQLHDVFRNLTTS